MSGAGTPPFHVVGGGLGGALMAIHLGQAGFRVNLYERREDPLEGGAVEGRSINLALSTRGFEALGRAGLADAVRRVSLPMKGRRIHTLDGRVTFQPYGTGAADAIHSVSRSGLNRVLLEGARAIPGVEVFFRHRCIAVDLDTGEARFETPGATVVSGAGVVVGADGAFSVVRREMLKGDRFEFSQSYLGHGYKELVIPPAPGGGFRLEPDALHIWPRGGFMMIALPNPDGSFTCTCFWAFEGPGGFGALRTPGEVLAYFRRVFPDAVPCMPTLADDYFKNPTSSLVTIRCAPWQRAGRAVLLGDAAHAVVPFYGQGANAAFEDCTVLMESIAAAPGDLERAFRTYFERRKPNVDALAELAVENFFEMRDKTASRWFLARKKLEKLLHRLLPGWYLPLYSMVSFSTIPYADARRRARRQDRIVAGAAAGLTLLALLAVWAWRRGNG